MRRVDACDGSAIGIDDASFSDAVGIDVDGIDVDEVEDVDDTDESARLRISVIFFTGFDDPESERSS